MSTRRALTIILVASIVMLAVGAGPQVSGNAAALPATQGPDPSAVTIPYSGRLSLASPRDAARTDEAGQPVTDGAYDFTFALYAAESGGEPIWTETQEDVAVQGGAFTVLLGRVVSLPQEVLEGGTRPGPTGGAGAGWLEVGVRGPGEEKFTLLAPRQRVSAASSPATAGSAGGMACPHDHFGETWTGSATYGLKIENNANGNGVSVWTNSEFATLYGYNASTGAGVFGSSASKGVHGSSSNGTGVYGLSTSGYGVQGKATAASGTTFGVYGESASTSGDGVYGYATAATGEAYGVYGRSNSTAGTGVFGRAAATSGTTYGVYGRSDSTSGTGVYGKAIANSGKTYGVYGESASTNGIGVYGKASAASGYTYGVYGEAQSDYGYGGYFKNTYGDGVYVTAGDIGVYVDRAVTNGVDVRSAGNNGVSVRSADYDGVIVNSAGIHGLAVNSAGGSGVFVGSTVDSGVYVQSAGKFGVRVFSAGQDGVYAVGNVNGVTGETTRADNLYGLFTVDYAFANTYHSLHGMMQVMQNGGSEPLEPGDVVIFSGIGAPLEGDDVPVVQVAKAASANSTGVAGVVVSRYNPRFVPGNAASGEEGISSADWDFTPDGPVPPGEYLLVVVQGQAQVKASALAGPIRPGDLLSSAAQAGYAVKAAEVSLGGVKMALPGTVFGKALEALDAGQGTGLVWVWVTLQ